MQTTEIFAELLVIGAGALLLVVVILAAVFGALPPISGLPTWLLFISLGAAYLLGVVMDRFADRLFQWRMLAAGTEPPDRERYRNERDRAIAASAWTMSMYAYSKSRQRLCRAWSLLGLGLAVAMPLASVRMGWPSRVAVAGAVCFALLAGACYFAWGTLKRDEIREIQRAAAQIDRLDGGQGALTGRTT